MPRKPKSKPKPTPDKPVEPKAKPEPAAKPDAEPAPAVTIPNPDTESPGASPIDPPPHTPPAPAE